VLLLSFEDDDQELDRRIAAALMHHKIDRGELKGWLFIAAPKGVKLAEMRNGSRQAGNLEKLLREAIERRKPDALGLDPFVKLHALEENDNGAMDFVCDLLTKLAIEYDIAVDAPHHTKKGTLAAGDADNGRGGSGIRDAARLVNTLAAMTEDEAKIFGIGDIERYAYVRLDPAKVNLVRKSQKATWFRLVSVPLDNGTKQYPNGDEVQTVEPWTPPETWANLLAATLNAALTEIDAGMSNGQRYSDAPNARDRAAWPVVQRHCPDKTEPQCREMIRTWVKNDVLYRDDYDDPIKRERCKGLRLDTTKRPS
jgi:AAA domain